MLDPAAVSRVRTLSATADLTSRLLLCHTSHKHHRSGRYHEGRPLFNHYSQNLRRSAARQPPRFTAFPEDRTDRQQHLKWQPRTGRFTDPSRGGLLLRQHGITRHHAAIIAQSSLNHRLWSDSDGHGSDGLRSTCKHLAQSPAHRSPAMQHAHADTGS
jgi:hypothetical protein